MESAPRKTVVYPESCQSVRKLYSSLLMNDYLGNICICERSDLRICQLSLKAGGHDAQQTLVNPPEALRATKEDLRAADFFSLR